MNKLTDEIVEYIGNAKPRYFHRFVHWMNCKIDFVVWLVYDFVKGSKRE